MFEKIQNCDIYWWLIVNFVRRKFETSRLQPNSIIVKKVLIASQLSLLLIGLLFSCKHMPEEFVEEPFIGGPPTSSIVCDEDSIYFQQQILPLFASSCAITDCHDQASHEDGIILDSYSNIISTGDIEGGNPNAGDIMEVITENDPDDVMPPDPYPPLSGDEIQMIEDWILQGALQNSCDALLCDTVEVTFSGDIMPLIGTFCEGCHSGSNAGGDILLNDYDDVFAIGESGSLWGSINWSDYFANMPQNSSKLTDCQIRMFEIWLDNGMPND